MVVEVPELWFAPGVSKVRDSVVVPDPESGVVPEHCDLLPLEALLWWECPAWRDYQGLILEVECSRARDLGSGRATLAVSCFLVLEDPMLGRKCPMEASGCPEPGPVRMVVGTLHAAPLGIVWHLGGVVVVHPAWLVAITEPVWH